MTSSDDDRAYLPRVPFPRELWLVDADAPEFHVPEGGIGLITVELPDGTPTAIGLYGRDAMVATFLLLGADRSPQRSHVQVPGVGALWRARGRFGRGAAGCSSSIASNRRSRRATVTG